eukprot:442327-Amphidinium_carterae.1
MKPKFDILAFGGFLLSSYSATFGSLDAVESLSGLLVTVLEMAFAARCGVTLDLPGGDVAALRQAHIKREDKRTQILLS